MLPMGVTRPLRRRASWEMERQVLDTSEAERRKAFVGDGTGTWLRSCSTRSCVAMRMIFSVSSNGSEEIGMVSRDVGGANLRVRCSRLLISYRCVDVFSGAARQPCQASSPLPPPPPRHFPSPADLCYPAQCDCDLCPARVARAHLVELIRDPNDARPREPQDLKPQCVSLNPLPRPPSPSLPPAR